MTIQEIIDQGPLSGPENPLWPKINPYQQQWIEDAHGKGTVDKLLALGSTEQRKAELLRMDETKLAQAKSEHGEQDKATIDAMHTLAGRYTEFGRFDDADKLYNEILANLRSTPDGEKQRLGVTYGLAHLRAQQGRWAESEELQRASLPLVSQFPLGMDSMQYLGAWRSIIEAVAHQPGRWDEANDMLDTGYGLVAKMKGGRFEKFHDEELQAMNEVRDAIQSLKTVDDAPGTAKL